VQPRIEYAKAAPGGMTVMLGLETYVRHCGLERSLMELVKVRASQINGCAYCVDMHTIDARAVGKTTTLRGEGPGGDSFLHRA
jgi:AhpD family alkylhydroperoxidase